MKVPLPNTEASSILYRKLVDEMGGNPHSGPAPTESNSGAEGPLDHDMEFVVTPDGEVRRVF